MLVLLICLSYSDAILRNKVRVGVPSKSMIALTYCLNTWHFLCKRFHSGFTVNLNLPLFRAHLSLETDI